MNTVQRAVLIVGGILFALFSIDAGRGWLSVFCMIAAIAMLWLSAGKRGNNKS